jgi:hypothetical protein
MSQITGRVERLCALLDEDDLWDYAEQAGAGQVLRQIVDIVDAGGRDDVLQGHLDALDEAMAAFGLGAITQPERVYQPLPGTGAAHPVVQAWACPARRPCSRVESTAAYPQPPVCATTGKTLTLVRVPT